MAVRTSVTTGADGRRVVAKVATSPEEATRLAHEAAQLDAARHPGVVELVGVDGHGVGAILLTGHVEGPTLAEAGALPLEEGVGLLAALATTLADLHDLGLVHGAVSADHVLVGPGGRPVLCSLGYGGRTGERQPAGAGDVLTPAVDVAALGRLARTVVPRPPAGHPLATMAAAADADDAGAGPSARALAEALQQEVPAARLPRGLAPTPPARPTPPRADPLAAWRRERVGWGRRRVAAHPVVLTVVVVTAAVGALAGALLLTRSGPGAPPPTQEAAAPGPDEPDPLPPDVDQPGPTTTTGRRPDCAPSSAVLHADVDGDGCPEALRYANGVLEAGSVRWAVGQAGDQVATGDWGCQGTRTVALYRPSTGELFRFEGWAGPGRELVATVTARVSGGQALRAADVDGDGCHEAVIERAAGASQVVPMPWARP